MASLNLCQFIGNIGKMDTRYSPDGSAITHLSIAVNETWKDKQTKEKKTRTEWVRVTMFGKLAEIAEKYLAVGAPVYISGRMQTRKYQDKDGQDRYTTEIVANDMQMLGGKPASTNDCPRDEVKTPLVGGSDFSDEIPF